MDVHLRSAFHSLLGRVRIGASRVRPLSPELHTSDYSFACPGSSTWVDKVPSRDTPSLNLAGHRSDVALDAPQVARSRSSKRRQRPSRVQRANSPYSVPKGMSQSWPIARHCMPQKQTHQIAMTALRSAAPARGGLGPDRTGRLPSLAMASSSTSTSSTKASTSANASHGPSTTVAYRPFTALTYYILWLSSAFSTKCAVLIHYATVVLALQLHIAHVRLSRTTFCGYLRHFPLNVPS